MIDRLSKKIGFTVTEIKVILFLFTVFLVGYFYKEFFNDNRNVVYKNYDYSEQDSLFEHYINYTGNESLTSEDNSYIKNEVLGLTEKKSDSNVELPPLTERSINLNTAGIAELVRLPGIGEKTAEKIIAVRLQKGRFNKPEELLEVKGIGEAKFNKIKKFLYIE